MILKHAIQALLTISAVAAFTPAKVNVIHKQMTGVAWKSCSLNMSTTSKNEIIRTALKKMRGVSVSVEFNSKYPKTDAEIEMLSQELRKAKVAAIFSPNVEYLSQMVKEQEDAKGNFPGPCPIIFNGDCDEGVINSVIDKGVNGIVCKPGCYRKDENHVQIITEVHSAQDIQTAIETGCDDIFLIIASGKSGDEIQSLMSEMPKESLVIASLDAMQSNSNELCQGKELGSIVADNGSKISALLIHGACIGDSEDLKYAQFIVENINKKSSSTFKMTGLTGSSNGHFGSNESGGTASAKWKRVEHSSAKSNVPF
jgi:hypothetical protein